ncbi:MAG TPA: methyltransferase domain-containing protein [Stenomitos sp.]
MEIVSTWFFDLIAPVYERVAHPLVMGHPAHVFELLQLQGTEKILDVGGGTGSLARLIVERTRAEVTVLDASRRMLDQIPDHPRLHKVHGPANSLPFHADSFDLVVSTAAMHWLTPHQATLSAMRRVLKVGGKLYLQDFDKAGLAGPLLTRGEELFKQGAEYLSRQELEPMLKEQGFSGRFVLFNLFQYAYIGYKEP